MKKKEEKRKERNRRGVIKNAFSTDHNTEQLFSNITAFIWYVCVLPGDEHEIKTTDTKSSRYPCNDVITYNRPRTWFQIDTIRSSRATSNSKSFSWPIVGCETIHDSKNSGGNI